MDSLLRDPQFHNMAANFHIPYYASYLKFCRKLGVEINLAKRKTVKIPSSEGTQWLEPNQNPSHTAITLATILHHHGFSFYVIDPPIGFPRAARKELKKRLKLKPKILALSTTFVISTVDIQYIIDTARKYSPDTKILVGGQYLLTSQDSMRELKEVDVFLLGECEDNLAPTVRALLSDDFDRLANIKGLVYSRNGKLLKTGPSPPVDLDHTLLSNWRLMSDFFPKRTEYNGSNIIEDGRGCAFKCTYCTFSKNTAYRLKSVERVIREIKAIPKEYQTVRIFLTSSTFTFPADRADAIAREIIKEGLFHRYMAYARPHNLSKGLVETMRKAHFYCLFFGLESMDQKVLDLARKKTTPAQIEQAVQLAHDAGIFTDCSFIIGLPGETSESVKKIEAFLQKPSVGLYHLFPLADMDSSDLAATSERFHFKRRDYLNWEHPGMNSQEVPHLMAKIIINTNRSSQTYSSLILDSVIGNNLSAEHFVSISPREVRSFFHSMEGGVVHYLDHELFGIKPNRRNLRDLAERVKEKYILENRPYSRAVESIKISLKIAGLKLLRSYLTRRINSFRSSRVTRKGGPDICL
jgi:tRNA A37 methylthiotransferase MiaB